MNTSAVAAAPWAVVQRIYRGVPVIDAVEVAAVTTTAVVELLPDNAYADFTAVPVALGPVYTASCAVVKLMLAFATMML